MEPLLRQAVGHNIILLRLFNMIRNLMLIVIGLLLIQCVEERQDCDMECPEHALLDCKTEGNDVIEIVRAYMGYINVSCIFI